MTALPPNIGPSVRPTRPALSQHRPHTNGTNACSGNNTTATIEATWLQSMLPSGRPRRISEMQSSGDRKYQDIKGDFTPTLIDAHIIGRTTYAATLDRNGHARLGIVDRDTGGEDVLIADLVRLARAGVTAVAIAMTTPNGHHGGHVVVPYVDFFSADDIRLQLETILQDASEVWPGSNQPVRLPIGYHKRARSWGIMLWLTPTGAIERLDLNDPAQRRQAWRILMGLRNSAPPPAPVVAQPRPEARPASPITHNTEPRTPGRQNAREVIARFNAEHPITDLLEHYGGVQTHDGWACNCGFAHTHSTQLAITSQGKIVSYSPNCRWAPHKESGKAQDAFGLYCLVEHHGDRVAALKAYNPIEPKPRTARLSTPSTEPDPALIAERNQDNQRKRGAYQAETLAIRASIEARMTSDERLSQAGQIVLLALLTISGDRRSCRLSVPAIAEVMAGLKHHGKPYSEPTIRRALVELRNAGYIESQGKGGSSQHTAIRTFKMQAYTSAAEISTLINMINDHIERACEGRAEATPAIMPAPELPRGDTSAPGGLDAVVGVAYIPDDPQAASYDPSAALPRTPRTRPVAALGGWKDYYRAEDDIAARWTFRPDADIEREASTSDVFDTTPSEMCSEQLTQTTLDMLEAACPDEADLIAKPAEEVQDAGAHTLPAALPQPPATVRTTERMPTSLVSVDVRYLMVMVRTGNMAGFERHCTLYGNRSPADVLSLIACQQPEARAGPLRTGNVTTREYVSFGRRAAWASVQYTI